jgi:YesN/AraC family two-component response regulator
MEIILVKNMVCHRCIVSVEDILNKAVIPFHKILSGEIHLANELSSVQKETLVANLKNEGFELIESHMSELIEKIKVLVTKRARNEGDKNEIRINLSTYLSEKLHFEYTYLSSSFSAVEGRSIDNFYIEQRVEKAKELISYGQKTLSEIAFELGYGNTAYLSTQFKKTTGTTPTEFKVAGIARRKVLNKS